LVILNVFTALPAKIKIIATIIMISKLALPGLAGQRLKIITGRVPLMILLPWQKFRVLPFTVFKKGRHLRKH
jgi:hypothetical protein